MCTTHKQTSQKTRKRCHWIRHWFSTTGI